MRVLDVSPMTALRPDAHTQMQYRRYPSRVLSDPDCLHLALPGVPDVWNALLLSRLGKCESPRGHSPTKVLITSR